MLDVLLRPLIDKPLDAAGRTLAKRGVSANKVTVAGLFAGLLAALAIVFGSFPVAIVLIVVNRVFDGLDGAVARASGKTDRGGYLDIVADYVFYASVPFAFAVLDPASNAVPAAALLASFCLTCSGFLAFATVAAKRGLASDAHGQKSFFYSTGLVEGTETIVFFLVMAAFPAWFPLLAWVFSGLCVLTAMQRTALAFRLF